MVDQEKKRDWDKIWDRAQTGSLGLLAIGAGIVVGLWQASEKEHARAEAFVGRLMTVTTIALCLVGFVLAYWCAYRIAVSRARAAEAEAESKRPLKEFMRARPYVKAMPHGSAGPDDHKTTWHRAVYHRGPVHDRALSVLFGIEVINYGKQIVTVRDIKDATLELQWEGGMARKLFQKGAKNVDRVVPLKPGKSYQHIHTVDVGDIEPAGACCEPHDGQQFGSIRVFGTLSLENDSRMLEFDESVPIPIAIEYAKDVRSAVDYIKRKIRDAKKSDTELTNSSAELTDTILEYDNSGSRELRWRAVMNPSITVPVALPSPGQSHDHAYEKSTLDKVADEIIARMRSLVTSKGSS